MTQYSPGPTVRASGPSRTFGRGRVWLTLGAVAAVLWLPSIADRAIAKGDGGSPSILPGGNSKEPVNIEADRLEYYNKDQKAIYIGNVIVVQGETSMKCTKLTIFINRQDKKDPKQPKAAPKPAAQPDAPGGDSVRHMDAEGPVTMVSKDQVGTGDRLEYDKPQNKVTLFGHVVLTQGTNVTKGDTLIYDLTTGVAHIESGGTTPRVSGYFVPGSGAPGGDKKAKGQDDTAEPPKAGKRSGRGPGRTASQQKRTE